MAGAEGVVQVDVGQRGQPLREGVFFASFGLVLGGRLILDLLGLVEAQVFEEAAFPVTQRCGCAFGGGAYTVFREDDALAEEHLQAFGDGPERPLGVGFGAFSRRAAQVTHENETTAVIQNVVYRGERHADSAVIGDTAVRVLGDVEVHTHQHALTTHVDVRDAFLRHGPPPL